MNLLLLWRLAMTFGTLSLLAIGGINATLPEIHRQIVDNLHLMDDAAFAKLFALAQLAPGPNVIVAPLIGWSLAGIAGFAVAITAIVLPSSLLAVVAGRSLKKFEKNDHVALLKKALAPLAVGLILASGYLMARATDKNLLTVALTLGTALFVYNTKANPLWAIIIGALAGFIQVRLGV
jgi:chromate transporter